MIRWTGLLFLLLVALLLGLLPGLLSPAGGGGMATLAEYLPTPRPDELCDLCEPNNSLSQACGPLAPGQSYRYFIRCTAHRDDDLYYIDLETPGMVTLDLTSIPRGTDYGIYLYDESGTLICYSQQPGNRDEHVSCDLSHRGRYYVRVYSWTGCSEDDPYTLAVAYPTPPPPPIPTATPAPPCNVHIDDFGDCDPRNDLGKLSGWELDPPGCGTFDVEYNGWDLQLEYDLTGPAECTARYTTTLSLDASPYEMLTFKISGGDKDELASTVIGLRDEVGHETRVKAGDFLNQVVTGTWQAVNLPLAAFANEVDTTQPDILLVEIADAEGASQGTIYLDSIRLERSLVPLTVDNFNDLADPNALGGGSGIYKDDGPGTVLETAYIADGTYDNSPGSYVISYTVPSGGWALWETDLPGLDVSDYAFLTFYIRGANSDEQVNLYLADGGGQAAYVDVEDYIPIATDWTLVRVPLQAFEGVALTDLAKIKLVFEWAPMSGIIFLDDLRFVADTLLIDSFCDSDWDNGLNRQMGFFASSSCTAAITPTLSEGSLRLAYDVTAGPDCSSGCWSQTLLDLNPYRTLVVKVRGEHCGQVAATSARTVPIETDKIKLGDYLPDGITEQWQEARIPLAASSVVDDWTRGDAYVIAFDAGQGASNGTTWWDDIAFETACVPLWVDNFNDEDSVNALLGSSNVFTSGAEITSTTSIVDAYGDMGAGLVLTYAVPGDRYAGWGTDLRNLDLSGYDRLIFQVKGTVDGEMPHIYLGDGANRKFVAAEVSTEWQPIVIELQSLHGVDLTRIQALEVVIEHQTNDAEGTLFLDDIRFLPSADCSQITRHLVHMPLTAKGYSPLALDPVWDFESGTEGWKTYETITYSRAVIDVTTSTFRSRQGNASLAATVDLVGGDDRLDRGAVFVDRSAPLDLSCKPLSCWLYVPTCGLGDPAEPNFVRLFVRDSDDKSEYGTPMPVVRNHWFEVNLRPSTLAPYEGSMQGGFNPHAITRLGVQFGAGSQETTYRGKVYIDACGWQEIDPTATAATEAYLPNKGGERVLPVLPRIEE